VPQDHEIHCLLRPTNVTTPIVTETKKQPSLQMAWAYFEYVLLPRYVVNEEDETSIPKDRKLRRFHVVDNPGKKHDKTKLYSPLFTPMSQMEDFGIDIGLYFYTLRAVIIMTLIAGLINIPNMLYFSGPEYSDNSQNDINWYLVGSAGCNANEWVPCPDCQTQNFDHNRRIIVQSKGGVNLPYLLKHTCGAQDDGHDTGNMRFEDSLISLATTIFIVASLVIISIYQNKKEIAFHKDEQAVQDYSIVIRNPPVNATNPEEWKNFFEENFGSDVHVTCCTVAIGNDKLVEALVQRRELLQRIERIVPDHESLPQREDYVIEMANLIQNERNVLFRLCAACGLYKGVPEYCKLLVRLNGKILYLASKDYPATNIFITFETEASQKQMLSKLMVAHISAGKNRKKDIEEVNHLFRKQHALHVEEAMEPSSIRWIDLNTTTLYQFNSMLAIMIISGLIIVLAAVAVKFCFEQGIIIGAIGVAFSNLVFPVVANALTNYETHKSEETKQISFYTKILIFSWVNTAAVTTIITPLASINVLLDRVFAIYLAELITSNVFQLADIRGNFKRHYVAPRMTTQESMNTAMEGPRYDLATRYTNMMKILFLTLWYCSIFPSVFFMCSCILCVNFFVDRFSMMVRPLSL